MIKDFEGATDMRLVGDEGVGRSCKKRLNSEGDRTAPWGTPLGKLRMDDLLLRRST